MNNILGHDLVKLISDASLAGVIIIFLITLIIYRKPISKYLECNKKTDNLINKVDKLTIELETRLNNPIEELKSIKAELQSEITKLTSEIRNMIADIKVKSSEDTSKIIKLENSINEIERKVKKLLSIVSKYLDIHNID